MNNKEQPTIESREADEKLKAPQGVESQEDMTSEAEKEVARFGQESEERLLRTEADAKKDGFTVDAGDKEELRELGPKAKEVKERFFPAMVAKAKRVMIGVSMLAATSGVAEGSSTDQKTEKIGVDTKIEMSVDAAREAANKEVYEKKMAELREATFFEDSERGEIGFKNKGKQEFFAIRGNENSLIFPLDKIKELLKDNKEKLELIHTHPIAAYPGKEYLRGLSQKDKAELDVIKEFSDPMPPSSSDIGGLVQQMNYLGMDAKRIENKVVDPTGTWGFSIDEHADFIKRYGVVMAYTDKFRDIDFIKSELGLSDEEIEALKKSLPKDIDADTNKKHPESRMAYAKSIPALKGLAEKFEAKAMEKYRGNIKENEMMQLDEIFGNGSSSLMSKISRNSMYMGTESLEELKEAFIKKSKSLGINISYQPFEKKADDEKK